MIKEEMQNDSVLVQFRHLVKNIYPYGYTHRLTNLSKTQQKKYSQINEKP